MCWWHSKLLSVCVFSTNLNALFYRRQAISKKILSQLCLIFIALLNFVRFFTYLHYKVSCIVDSSCYCECSPVSYTHLDVYKRQLLYLLVFYNLKLYLTLSFNYYVQLIFHCLYNYSSILIWFTFVRLLVFITSFHFHVISLFILSTCM